MQFICLVYLRVASKGREGAGVEWDGKWDKGVVFGAWDIRGGNGSIDFQTHPGTKLNIGPFLFSNPFQATKNGLESQKLSKYYILKLL